MNSRKEKGTQRSKISAFLTEKQEKSEKGNPFSLLLIHLASILTLVFKGRCHKGCVELLWAIWPGVEFWVVLGRDKEFFIW